MVGWAITSEKCHPGEGTLLHVEFPYVQQREVPIWTEDSQGHDQEQFCGLMGEGQKDTTEKVFGKFLLIHSGLYFNCIH